MTPLPRRLLFCFLVPLAAAAAPPRTLTDFQAEAARFNEVLTAPEFEQTADQLSKAAADGIAAGNKSLDAVGQQPLDKVTFASTVAALDELRFTIGFLANRIHLIQQTSPDAHFRDAAEAATKTVQDWSVGADYRQDVYAAVQAFAKTNPTLAGEDARLLAEALRDYRRAGLALPAEKRSEVERLRKELAGLETDFQANVVKSTAHITFSRDELAGVPAEFVDSPKVKGADGRYTVAANETYQAVQVLDNATLEATRKKTYVARERQSRDNNGPLFNDILSHRNKIALLLGYASWADYQTEVKMAKTGRQAEEFVDQMIAGTKPKFDAEVAEMQKLKAADTNDPKAVIGVWDWRYYANQIRKTRYAIDTEQLRVFFPMQQVIAGLFRVYEKDFGLKFTEVEPPYRWVKDLTCYVAADAGTGEPMGLFYFDLFPRTGKYNHFAEFSIIDGHQLSDGKYQRPVVTLVCNFPPPGENGEPSLLSHDDVVTIFHEFGHALHGMLTRAKFSRFAGTNVPGDFVEAPSQMLENWAWDKTVLDSFAADYRDPSKKIPAELLAKMKEAELATSGVYHRRQFAFAKFDLALHDPHPAGEPYDCVRVSNEIMEKVFLPIDPVTSTITTFGHLCDGYDAGYYGYAWAEAIAADMATVFRKAPGGFMDADAGAKLRTEIYQPGSSRDVSVSIEQFLGRKQSIEPFLENRLGLKPTAATPDAVNPPAASVK